MQGFVDELNRPAKIQYFFSMWFLLNIVFRCYYVFPIDESGAFS